MTTPDATRSGRTSVRAILLGGVAYGVIGVATAELAGRASGFGVAFWRYAAWVLSAVVVVWHLRAAQFRRGLTTFRSAGEVALGAAVGGVLLALGGPVRSHWSAPDRDRVLLSLVLFPAFMAGAAMIGALVVGFVARLRK